MIVGLATGVAQAVQLNAVVGSHANVPLPAAMIVVLSPKQIVLSSPALTEGGEVTVTIAWLTAVPQLLVTVKV